MRTPNPRHFLRTQTSHATGAGMFSGDLWGRKLILINKLISSVCVRLRAHWRAHGWAPCGGQRLTSGTVPTHFLFFEAVSVSPKPTYCFSRTGWPASPRGVPVFSPCVGVTGMQHSRVLGPKLGTSYLRIKHLRHRATSQPGTPNLMEAGQASSPPEFI